MIVLLIVGILAAVSIPLYLGYITDAKMAEGKMLAGSLWTSLQAAAIANCGQPTSIESAFARAGLNGEGQTNPPRWGVADGATLTVSCSDSSYTASRAPLFVFSGLQADIAQLRVGLFYNAGAVPPSTLRCMTDGTIPTPTSPIC